MRLPQAVLLLPLGAAAKEHGPHLRLDNDLRLAEALSERVMARTEVIVAPTLSYHHYPAFLAYPGSISLSFDVACGLVVDIVTSLTAHGPRRFYVLNTGVSTAGPLAAAAGILADRGVQLRFSDISKITADTEARLLQQQRGSHADEAETSMMLYLMPDRVDMPSAVRDDHPRHGPGGFSREPGRAGIYSPSGVWGDPTLADARKGAQLVEAFVAAVSRDIEDLRAQPLD